MSCCSLSERRGLDPYLHAKIQKFVDKRGSDGREAEAKAERRSRKRGLCAVYWANGGVWQMRPVFLYEVREDMGS